MSLSTLRTFEIEGHAVTMTATHDEEAGKSYVEFHLDETGELLPQTMTIDTIIFAGITGDVGRGLIQGMLPDLTEYLKFKEVI